MNETGPPATLADVLDVSVAKILEPETIEVFVQSDMREFCAYNAAGNQLYVQLLLAEKQPGYAAALNWAVGEVLGL